MTNSLTSSIWTEAVTQTRLLRPDFVPVELMHATDKSILIAGTCCAEAAVAKVLTSRETFWREKFTREIAVYRAFARSAPPVRVPHLIAADAEQGVLLLEHLPGRRLGPDRYPPAPLARQDVCPAVDALGALAHWAPAPGAFAHAWDYEHRLDRYLGYGLVQESDHRALTRLLQEAGSARYFAHGDPLPGNILLDRHRVGLLDWEFAGYYLRHLDWALLWVLLRATPVARTLIEERVAAGDPADQAAFTVNRAMLLTRELRTHQELPTAPWQQARLAALTRDWDALCADWRR
ncbi:aminoglycoside phosphotransferase [Streptosporangium nondiastaticum]|uniref:Aminoglycoside phosphotransferase n=1 Tax=Streptosporangium nondiastaticum TaxID=35764 RepID=A0A9X7JVF0_9ACTN|nr:aminoglycoside phosphotransferase [Streptosporangium nondiastaticum]